MKRVKTVDEYIESAPKAIQGRLADIRKVVKSATPKAEEKISYGMPYYGYKGKLAYFGYARNHIGLYIPPPVIDDFKEDLKAYKTAKATVQFPNSEQLPLELIKKLIKARIKINEKAQS